MAYFCQNKFGECVHTLPVECGEHLFCVTLSDLEGESYSNKYDAIKASLIWPFCFLKYSPKRRFFDRIRIMESRLSPHGPSYGAVKSFHLAE